MPTDEQLLEMRYQLTNFFEKRELVEAYCRIEQVTRGLETPERVFVFAMLTCCSVILLNSAMAQGSVTAYLRSAHEPDVNSVCMQFLAQQLGVALVPPAPKHPIDDEGRR